jgi:hypothetical protein
MTTPLPNRIAVYFAGIAALLGAVIPVVGNFDWESTVGVLGGLAALATVVSVWLHNWGKWERGEGLVPGELGDDFDEDAAGPVPAQVVEQANVSEQEVESGKAE